MLDGKIYITNYRVRGDILTTIQLLFIENKEEKQQQGNELTSFLTFPYGYVLKYKFALDKKEHILELQAKDQRYCRFRFDSAFSHQRASDAMSRHCDIKKQRDLFTYDYSKKLKE